MKRSHLARIAFTLIAFTTMSLLVMGTGCSAPCFTNLALVPDEVCFPADAGAPEPGRPFSLTAKFFNTNPVSVACEVSVDAGVIILSTTISGCGGGNPMNPLIAESRGDCAVPALESGRYVVTSRMMNSTLDFTDAGSGIRQCP